MIALYPQEQLNFLLQLAQINEIIVQEDIKSMNVIDQRQGQDEAMRHPRIQRHQFLQMVPKYIYSFFLSSYSSITMYIQCYIR